MKVLFITPPEEDYLADSLLIGFRALSEIEVIDYPRREVLYSGCPESVRSQVRGKGFTLYTGLLKCGQKDRFRVRPKLEEHKYDLVVFSDIWHQYGIFLQWRPYLHRGNTIICDGADSPQVYPYAGWWWRRAYNWFLPRAHRQFLYFKREWTAATQFNLWHRLLPRSLWPALPSAKNLRGISFSIPEEKIVSVVPTKQKDFPRHIVDPEVAAQTRGSATKYAFDSEADYYRDLQESRFGVTTKRSGWDCLRHYEIAANGAVPCFRDLDKKPATCAPHGLVDGVNCISYRSHHELMQRIKALSAQQYEHLRLAAVSWARTNSCRSQADRVLSKWRQINPSLQEKPRAQ